MVPFGSVRLFRLDPSEAHRIVRIGARCGGFDDVQYHDKLIRVETGIAAAGVRQSGRHVGHGRLISRAAFSRTVSYPCKTY